MKLSVYTLSGIVSLFVEIGLLTVLIARRKQIPKTIFTVLLLTFIYWLSNTFYILYGDDSILVSRIATIFFIYSELASVFGLFYFYISPEKWKRNLRLIFLFTFLILSGLFYYNFFLQHSSVTFLTQSLYYLILTPLAIVSFFQIHKKDMHYKWLASPRFFLSIAELFYLLTNSSMYLFSSQLYLLNKSTYLIIMTIHLFSWFPVCFLYLKALLTFDIQKENNIIS